MELYELGMALSVVLIAAFMDLLDASEPHQEAERARLARQARRHRSGPRTKAPRVQQRERSRRRPEPTTDAGAARPVDRERGTVVLTWVTTSYHTTTGREQPEQAAAPETYRSAQAGPASHAIGALCSTGAAIPLPAVACWPPEPPRGGDEGRSRPSTTRSASRASWTAAGRPGSTACG